MYWIKNMIISFVHCIFSALHFVELKRMIYLISLVFVLCLGPNIACISGLSLKISHSVFSNVFSFLSGSCLHLSNLHLSVIRTESNSPPTLSMRQEFYVIICSLPSIKKKTCTHTEFGCQFNFCCIVGTVQNFIVNFYINHVKLYSSFEVTIVCRLYCLKQIF